MMTKSFFFALTCAIFLGSGLFSDQPITERNKTAHQLTLLRSEALGCMDSGDYTKAVALIKKALSLSPQDWLDLKEYNELLISLAISQVKLELFKEALTTLEQLKEKGICEDVIYGRSMTRAKALFGLKEFEESLISLHTLNDFSSSQTWPAEDRKFYLKVAAQVDGYYDDLFKQAEKCFAKELYEETYPLYEEILTALNKGVYKKEGQIKLPYQLKLRLAFCHYQLSNFSQAKSMLKQVKNDFAPLFDADSFLQLIQCEKEEGNLQNALDLCEEFQTFKYSPLKEKHAKLLKAQIIHLNGEKDLARKLLTDLLADLNDVNLITLAHLSLAQIYIDQNDFDKALNCLEPKLKGAAKIEDSIKAQWLFLRSELHFKKRQYEVAKVGFQDLLEDKALNKYFTKKMWQKAHLLLGQTLLMLSSDTLLQNKTRLNFLEKGIKEFEILYQLDPSDHSRLLLIKALFKTYLLNQSDLVRKKGLSLIKKQAFKKPEDILLANFFLAETLNLEEREKIYGALCHEKYASAENYAKAWYYRAVNFQALTRQLSETSAEYHHFFVLAIEAFKKAESLIRQKDKSFLDQTQEALCDLYRISPTNTLLKDGLEYVAALYKNKEDLKFKSQLVCSALPICIKLIKMGEKSYLDEGFHWVKLANLQQKEELFKVRFYEGVLHFLKGDYGKCEQVLTKLIQKEESDTLTPSALFILAEVYQAQKMPQEEISHLFRRLYEEYPNHKFAHEAYFRTFPFAEYLEGKLEAINHLENFSEHFPQNEFFVPAHYLLGLHYQNLTNVMHKDSIDKALHHFEKAAQIFLDLYRSHSFNHKGLKYFGSIYYESVSKKAHLYFHKAKGEDELLRETSLKEALKTYESLCSDFEDPSNQLVKAIWGDSDPEVYKRCAYEKGLVYLSLKEVELAEAQFSNLIERLKLKGDKIGQFIYKASYELAQISLAKEDFELALSHIEDAKTYLGDQGTGDQKADLGIQKSFCYRLLKDYDRAEICLSEVINEEIVSSLRIKAMVLRAEIFELQGKKNLAFKQLEAASKSEGDWAQIAKDKLVNDYGVN